MTEPNAPAFAWYTATEAAAMTGLAPVTWRARCEKGRVPGAVKVAKTWLIPSACVEEMAAKRQAGGHED